MRPCSFQKANKNWKSNDILRRRKINPFVGLCWSLPRVCFTAVEMTLGTSVADFDWVRTTNTWEAQKLSCQWCRKLFDHHVDVRDALWRYCELMS